MNQETAVRDHVLGQAFLRVSSRFADRPALIFPDGAVILYQALARESLHLATHLGRRGISPHQVVALQNHKSPSGYALMLACLHLGAAYVNLDDQSPPQRLAKILISCRPCLLVSDGPISPSIAAACAEAGVCAIVAADIETAPPASDEAAASGADEIRITGASPAYVMFTSGSTGLPKGAVINHAAVLNFIDWCRIAFAITPNDVLTNVNPIYFDNSVFDFYAALFNGAALCAAPSNLVQNPGDLVAYVARAKCTIWFSVPSLLIYLMTMRVLDTSAVALLRTIVFGGEGYPISELAKLAKLIGPDCTLMNVYGPTECTCICSAYQVSPVDLAKGMGLPPIGRIAPDFSWTLLDGDKKVASGDVGELCLMGPQLALGYLHDVERTRAAFVTSPINEGWPERMYRTGDLMRIKDGLLHFVGRKDNQIKHQGYRIELEEIEAALNAIPGVVQAAVVYKRVHDSFGHIIAWVAARPGLDQSALRAALAEILPTYMIPNRFELRTELPKSATGKVDRSRLAAE